MVMEERPPAARLTEYLAAIRDEGLPASIIRVSNSYLEARTLWLEPWGASVEMPAGASFDVVEYTSQTSYEQRVYVKRAGDWLTVEVSQDGVTVYASTGNLGFAVFLEGQAVWQWPPRDFANRS